MTSPGGGYQGANTTGYPMQYQIGSPSFVSSPSGFNPNLISTPQVILIVMGNRLLFLDKIVLIIDNFIML